MRKPTSLLAAIGLALLLPGNAWAGTAQSGFGIRLVIEPPCPQGASQVAGELDQALVIAKTYFAGEAIFHLQISHFVEDTGQWLVRVGEGKSILIDKCSGSISELPSRN